MLLPTRRSFVTSCVFRTTLCHIPNWWWTKVFAWLFLLNLSFSQKCSSGLFAWPKGASVRWYCLENKIKCIYRYFYCFLYSFFYSFADLILDLKPSGAAICSPSLLSLKCTFGPFGKWSSDLKDAVKNITFMLCPGVNKMMYCHCFLDQTNCFKDKLWV